MSVKIATGIKTELWFLIVEYLKNENWSIVNEYNLFDKGIDFDLYEFKKNNDKILMAWDNWMEGELKCTDENFMKLEKYFNTQFSFEKGDKLYLSIPEIIKNYLKNK